MDFQAYIDVFDSIACVVSVEKLPTGGWGKICMFAANAGYVESVEHPSAGIELNSRKFVPNSEYTLYTEKDLNFERACYEAAVNKKSVHAYVKPERFDAYLNLLFLPIAYEEDNICYCTYIMEINEKADASNMSSISGDLAAAVLETTIMLRGTTDFKKTMQDVVKSIRKLCKAENCVILHLDNENEECSILGEDLSEDNRIPSMRKFIERGFYKVALSWEDTIARSNCLIVADNNDMKVLRERNPGWYETLEEAGVETLALFPLRSRGQLLGYMWVTNFHKEDCTKIKETLELTTFILSSEINNYLMMDRLRTLSSRDMLTGVYNRNEMNVVVDMYASNGEKTSDSLGIIFADLNGLKIINDEGGHNAGDALLKNAADVLCEVFDEKYIFRAGGDEFAIIIKGISESEIEEKIARIRETSERYADVSFALGSSVVPNSRDIRKALRQADERMYEDKKIYYEMHPEKRRGASKDNYRLES
ncbi:MAG: sensor domain-containing diguanylate cyclase [Butyrivibrio sp.]|nr:sensor domain-containing diguanylate cyclase [Butyrivibrio sp.]